MTARQLFGTPLGPAGDRDDLQAMTSDCDFRCQDFNGFVFFPTITGLSINLDGLQMDSVSMFLVFHNL